MATRNERPQIIFHGANGNNITFTYENMEKLAYDMKFYFPKLFPHLKDVIKKKLQELYA